jgi:hypothetical protein
MKKLLIAIPLTAAAVAGTTVAADRVLRKIRPMTVPAILEDEVDSAREAGLRLCNWHKFRCTKTGEHVHMTTPDGRVQITLGADMLAVWQRADCAARQTW